MWGRPQEAAAKFEFGRTRETSGPTARVVGSCGTRGLTGHSLFGPSPLRPIACAALGSVPTGCENELIFSPICQPTVRAGPPKCAPALRVRLTPEVLAFSAYANELWLLRATRQP